MFSTQPKNNDGEIIEISDDEESEISDDFFEDFDNSSFLQGFDNLTIPNHLKKIAGPIPFFEEVKPDSEENVSRKRKYVSPVEIAKMFNYDCFDSEDENNNWPSKLGTNDRFAAKTNEEDSTDENVSRKRKYVSPIKIAKMFNYDCFDSEDENNNWPSKLGTNDRFAAKTNEEDSTDCQSDVIEKETIITEKKDFKFYLDVLNKVKEIVCHIDSNPNFIDPSSFSILPKTSADNFEPLGPEVKQIAILHRVRAVLNSMPNI